MATAPVLVTWTVGVVVAFTVHMGEGLGRPSEGLALSAAALPAALVALIPPRRRRSTAFLAVVLLGVLALVNALYHRAFDTYLPLQAVGLVDQGWAVREYVAGLLWIGDALPLLAVLLGAAALLGTKGRTDGLDRRWHTGLPAVLCLAGAVPALGWSWLVAPTDADHDTGGFLYAHLVEARFRVGEWRTGGEPTAGERARVARYLEDRPPPSPAADPWFGRVAGSSVLMIQVEALNAWLLDAEVGGEPVVPVLRSLARRGLHFTRVFDQTHQGRSSDADYLVMASRHPLERAAVSMVHPTMDPVALPDLLRERGYATLSAHAHHRGFWNAGQRHPRYGFQESLFDVDLGPGESLGFGLVDRVFFERVAPRVAALPRPYLAWLITLTMHGPYPRPPPSFRVLPLDTLEGTSLGGYYLRARHTDAALGAFLDTLEASGALENTTLVVYGDHAESELFEPGVLDALAGVEGVAPGARALLRERVPVVVVPPGGMPGRRVDTVGGLVDLGPTLLHLLGIPVPRGFLGRPMTVDGPGFAPHASGEVVAGERMWTGEGCHAFPAGTPLPGDACDGIRARAREELEVSWILTRHRVDLGLDSG